MKKLVLFIILIKCFSGFGQIFIWSSTDTCCPYSQVQLMSNQSVYWKAGNCNSSTIGHASTITVNPSVTTTYFAYVGGCYPNFCSCSPSQQKTIIVKPKPAMAGIISGPLSVCSGVNATYTILPILNEIGRAHV